MFETIKNRRSIRNYKPGIPVTKEQLEQILKAAMYAPSARNARPWEFIVITRREILNKIAEDFPNAGMCSTAVAVIVVVAVPGLEKAPGFFPQDCGAATQNILLAAHELGLGTCWCGFYPREERTAELSKLLSIDESKLPFCVIALGVPDENPECKGFFEPEKVTFID